MRLNKMIQAGKENRLKLIRNNTKLSANLKINQNKPSWVKFTIADLWFN